MPKQPSVPRYRLHKARNCAVVTIRGRNFYLGEYDSPESKEKYARLIAEHFGNGHRAAVESAKEPAAPTINELILRYWTEHVEGYYVKNGKPSDRQYHIRLALAPLRKLYGRTLAKDFGPKKLKAIRNEILDEGMRTRGGLNRGYVNDHVGIIKKMFRWAVSEEMLPREIGPALCGQLDAVENLHKGKDPRVREGRKIPSAPKSDIRKARRCMSRQIRIMVDLQLITGMRPDEVTIMRPGDIEHANGIWLYRPQDHKLDHKGIRRVVPLGPRAQKLLAPWLDRDPEAFLFSPREVVEARREEQRNGGKPGTRRKRRVRKRNGTRLPRERYDDESYCQAVERACAKAKVKKWTPGQLRHNAATRVNGKFDRETAQQLLGHGSATTTDIYIDKQMEKAIQAMKTIG
jgi:integrase